MKSVSAAAGSNDVRTRPMCADAVDGAAKVLLDAAALSCMHVVLHTEKKK